jgi:hypothetical protein
MVLQKRSHRANEYICLVKQDLAKAVDQCIDAVGYEFDTEVQKMLIRVSELCGLGERKTWMNSFRQHSSANASSPT